jgi:hypothetical protein
MGMWPSVAHHPNRDHRRTREHTYDENPDLLAVVALRAARARRGSGPALDALIEPTSRRRDTSATTFNRASRETRLTDDGHRDNNCR